MELESKIQSRIIGYLRANGYFVTKLSVTSTTGIPDVLAIKDGKALFVEVKRKGNKPSELQLYRIKELQSYGAECIVAYSIEDLVKIVNKP